MDQGGHWACHCRSRYIFQILVGPGSHCSACHRFDQHMPAVSAFWNIHPAQQIELQSGSSILRCGLIWKFGGWDIAALCESNILAHNSVSDETAFILASDVYTCRSICYWIQVTRNDHSFFCAYCNSTGLLFHWDLGWKVSMPGELRA